MVKETVALFEGSGKGKIILNFYLDKSNPGDKVQLLLNGEELGTYSEGESVTLDPGDKIDFNPLPDTGSYFSYFEGMDPPKVLSSNETVRVVFKSNG